MDYPILIYPAEEGGFVAEVISLPGCLAQGENYIECLKELDVVSKIWIEEYLLNNKSLPDPQNVLDKIINFNKYEYA